jgi:hypothetical protein
MACPAGILFHADPMSGLASDAGAVAPSPPDSAEIKKGFRRRDQDDDRHHLREISALSARSAVQTFVIGVFCQYAEAKKGRGR